MSAAALLTRLARSGNDNKPQGFPRTAAVSFLLDKGFQSAGHQNKRKK